MICQSVEAQQKGVQAVGQLHTAMNEVGQSPINSYNDRLTAAWYDKF